MDSELFLVLLIAPLLFDESRNADKRAMWTNKGAIVSLAIGLVLVTVLAVGFVLHWIEPSIPLAAAFALGAALGPTDAVAVSSLSKEVKLSKRQETLLSGEALINDASGVVSFQFAIAAATTGAFSLVDASASFVASFFGGIAMGLVLGGVAVLAMRFIRMRGYESVTTHVVFEVFTPFFVFMAAESIHVSGILAVVAAGLLTTFAPKPISSMTTKLELASSSVWDVLGFVANGVVFVLLGMELPQAILPGWNDFEMNNSLVIGASLTIVALLVVVRFLWFFVLDAMAQHRQSKKAGHGSGRRTHGGAHHRPQRPGHHARRAQGCRDALHRLHHPCHHSVGRGVPVPQHAHLHRVGHDSAHPAHGQLRDAGGGTGQGRHEREGRTQGQCEDPAARRG